MRSPAGAGEGRPEGSAGRDSPMVRKNPLRGSVARGCNHEHMVNAEPVPVPPVAADMESVGWPLTVMNTIVTATTPKIPRN